jgi:poly(beta-D-mannuronate) C5 epimerase
MFSSHKDTVQFKIKAMTAGMREFKVLISMMIILSQSIFLLPLLNGTPLSANAQEQQRQLLQGTESNSCITYDSTENAIRISCKHTSLTNIDNQLQNPDLLHKETTNGVWLLNAGIVIEQGATLYINSTDTSWLKINADGETAYPILISGSLKIDSVKVTSWNPNTNGYATTEDSHREGVDVEVGTPRPYIRIQEATGTTDITNSELAYLGYEGGLGAGRSGLRYDGGVGSIVRGNNIHNMWFAFYSDGVGGMVVENNHIHHNGHYGLDPHTGTHDMIIRNNIVHDNGAIGIICSVDCHNVTIENNKVYNNTNMGIMLSRNMYDSVVRHNIVSDQEQGIVISESHNNEIYNNTVSDSGNGIDIDEDSFENAVYNNAFINILDPFEALRLRDGASEQNTLHSNTLITINGERIILGGEQG